MHHSHTDTDKIIIHTDAARDDHVTGLGYTIDGEVSLSGRKYLTGHYTSMEAEFHALVEAVRIASKESQSRVCCEVYTDCEPLMRKINGSEPIRDDWAEYHKSARWLLDKFDSWELSHTSRSNNTDAHTLAREALECGRQNR